VRKYTLEMILSPGFTGSNELVAVWVLGLSSGMAVLAYACAALLSDRSTKVLRNILLMACLTHAFAIASNMFSLGSTTLGARFGFAPALSMTTWLVVVLYMIESRFVPLPGARQVLACLGLLVVLLAWLFPGESHASTSSRWAPLHWALGLASYGLFGAAVLHAAMLNRAEQLMRSGLQALSMPLLQLERMTFRFVAAGFVALSATLVLGLPTPGVGTIKLCFRY
jgi:ABC-type uncharacterized transport system permease subunit